MDRVQQAEKRIMQSIAAKQDEESKRLKLTDGIPLDRLAEICAAEQDGRCVVLPCKVGAMLYEIAQKWTKCAAFDTERDEYNCQGCEEERCDSHKEFYVRSIKPLSLSELVKYIPNVGKTVFLTRAEAEATLASTKQVVASTVASEVHKPGGEQDG